jgi:serine/threonine protein phosphatase 1
MLSKSEISEKVLKTVFRDDKPGEDNIASLFSWYRRRANPLVKLMVCKLDLPLGPSFRDAHIEADVQARIDKGYNVWAVGDIHGHLGTFRALVHRLKLGNEDRIICLGDMIDRGPDSAGLIEFIRSDPRIICLKGNHELMALSSLENDGGIELWQPWLARGGRSTWGSYIVRAEGDLYEAKRQLADDLMWMDNLPNHIVLDSLRLVHAGYDPRMPLDSQGDKELLWIRKRFYEHEYAIDPDRTVIFGHSTTTKVGPAPGEVVHSTVQLPDQRPAWIAMDIGAFNHVSPGLAAMNLSSFRIVKQGTLRSERWFDIEGCKEAKVGSHYGLDLLRNQNRREAVSALRARRKLKMAGVVLQEDIHEYDMDSMPRHLLFTSREFEAEDNRIIFGPGTSPEEKHLRLPGPTGFRVYRRIQTRKSLGIESTIQQRKPIQG